MRGVLQGSADRRHECRRCTLKRAPRWAGLVLLCSVAAAHETLTTTVLFDREIVRVLDAHCAMCHAQNGPAFPLETYEQTWLKKREIRAEVISRHMPPWPAVPGYGLFANDNNLTLRETQFVNSWVEGLGPRNSGVVFTNVSDPGAVKPKEVRAHADFSHFHLGDPQLTLHLAPQTIEAKQANQIKRVVVETGLSAEKRLRAIEFMPGDRRVVRAAFFQVQETGQWIGSWTPWYGFMNLPKGLAYRLPAGAHIVAEIHYKSAAERVSDSGSLGLFLDDAAAQFVSEMVLTSTSKLSADTRVIALRPDIQPGMQSLEVAARRPDGGTDVLLFARDFSMDWPTPFVFKIPVAIPRGSELSVTAHFASGARQGIHMVATVVQGK